MGIWEMRYTVKFIPHFSNVCTCAVNYIKLLWNTSRSTFQTVKLCHLYSGT